MAAPPTSLLAPGGPTDDPSTYWNGRARRFAGDPLRAVGLDDPLENHCIDRIQRHLLTAAIRHVERRAPLQGKTVLDYGCGSGRWVTFLRARGLAYSGADIAAEMLALARCRHADADFRPTEDHRLPYPDAHFDLLWSVAVLHHNRHDVQEQIMREMVRVARANGTLILFEGLGAPGAPDTNYFPRPLHEWLELAARHGLSCTWRRGASYMLLRALVTRCARWVRPATQGSLRRLLTRVDAVVDPYLLPVLPQRYHRRAAMVFGKSA